METPKNEVEGAENVEQKKELVEFDATPREELEKMATNLMSDQERAELQNGEVNLILRIARMNIERKEVPPSISDAIADAAILRLGVREFSQTLVVGPDGHIIASGSSRIGALRKAQGETAE